MVAVLDEIGGVLRPARAEVDDEHRLDAGKAAPVDELVRAERVGFGRRPGVAQPFRPLLDGTDAVFPIVGRDEVPAGVAYDRDAELPDEVEHVATKPLLICGRVAGLEHAPIDGAAQMFDEGAEQAPIDAADGEVSIE